MRPVVLGYFLDRAVAEELDALGAASLRHAGKVFEGVEGRLPRIAQDMPVFAAVKGYAHQAVDRRPDFPDSVHFLVEHISRHVPALEEVAVEPPKVTIDLFLFLDFLDAIDRSGLAVAEKLRRLLALDLRHFADEIVA